MVLGLVYLPRLFVADALDVPPQGGGVARQGGCSYHHFVRVLVMSLSQRQSAYLFRRLVEVCRRLDGACVASWGEHPLFRVVELWGQQPVLEREFEVLGELFGHQLGGVGRHVVGVGQRLHAEFPELGRQHVGAIGGCRHLWVRQVA